MKTYDSTSSKSIEEQLNDIFSEDIWIDQDELSKKCSIFLRTVPEALRLTSPSKYIREFRDK